VALLEAKRDLRNHLMANPKADPERWALENAPRYITRADDKVSQKLQGIGLIPITGANGELDKTKTWKLLQDQLTAGSISTDKFDKATAVLDGRTTE
jgi:hypothetical protein